MLICFACPSCKSHLEIDAQTAGTQIACPTCNTLLTVPKADIGPGVTLGGFRIERLLGRGGMGEVYLACQKSMDRKIALKVLPRALTAEKDAVSRFRSEVRVLAQLKHPNIVTAYEAGEDGGVHFLAMEYVEGETLEARLKRGEPLSETQALGLTLKLSEALGRVWTDHAMVHRDVKPANILLDRHGEPRLTDMGLSRIAGARQGMTMAGEVMGTPNYMSPEQGDGLAGVDFRADIYSLGATLYHMLTAKVPFAGSTFMETLRKQTSETLPDPRTFNPKVSPACVALLETMLARRANRRHATWEALVADIRRVMDGKMPATPVPPEGESLLQHSKAAAGHHHRKVVVKAAHSGALPPPAPVTAPESDGHGVVIAAIVIIGLILVGVLFVVKSGNRQPTGAAAQAVAAAPAVTPPTDQRPPAAQSVVSADEIARLKAANQKRKLEVWNALKADFDQKWATGKTREAVELVETYHGPFAQELVVPLSELAQYGRAKLESRWAPMSTEAPTSNRVTKTIADVVVVTTPEAPAPKPAKLADPILDEVATLLLKGDESAAAKRLSDARYEAPLQSATNTLEEADALIMKGVLSHDPILKSFADDKGRTVEVGLMSGKRVKFQIGRVEDGKVVCWETMEDARIERRLSPHDLSVAEQLRRTGTAKTPELGLARGLLLARTGKSTEARAEFEGMGAPIGQALARVMERQAKPPPEPPVSTNGPSVLPTVRATGRIAIDEQAIKKAGEKLAASMKSPTFDLLAYTKIEEDGLVIDLSREKSLRDLTPLSALPIKRLDLTDTGVNNLTPLQNMPLESLVVCGSREFIYGLRPLHGLPLRKLVLGIWNNAGCRPVHVPSLAPLKGLPLEELQLYLIKDPPKDSPPFDGDLTPLRGMKLRNLTIDGAQDLVSLAPLTGMPITNLCLRGCRIRDLKALQGLPLTALSVVGTDIRDLSPLKGMPLISLDVGRTLVADLSPLKDLPLERLIVSDTKVTDLSPLAGTRLTYLNTRGCRVTDFAPVAHIKQVDRDR